MILLKVFPVKFQISRNAKRKPFGLGCCLPSCLFQGLGVTSLLQPRSLRLGLSFVFLHDILQEKRWALVPEQQAACVKLSSISNPSSDFAL